MKEINAKKIMKAYKEYRSCQYLVERNKDSLYYSDLSEKRDSAWKEFCAVSEKLSAEIEKAEGRPRERTISAADVVTALESVEKKLGLRKCELEDVVVHIDIHAQDFPRAYKYTPKSTQFTAVFRNGSWRILHISREITRKYGQKYHVELSDVAKQAILKSHEWF